MQSLVRSAPGRWADRLAPRTFQAPAASLQNGSNWSFLRASPGSSLRDTQPGTLKIRRRIHIEEPLKRRQPPRIGYVARLHQKFDRNCTDLIAEHPGGSVKC